VRLAVITVVSVRFTVVVVAVAIAEPITSALLVVVKMLVLCVIVAVADCMASSLSAASVISGDSGSCTDMGAVEVMGGTAVGNNGTVVGMAVAVDATVLPQALINTAKQSKQNPYRTIYISHGQ